MTTFAPGSVIRTRNRLRRVDGQPEDGVLVACTIDGGEVQQLKLYVPFEDIQPGQLESPSTEIVGHIQAQDLLLRAYRLSLLHGTAPLLSLQRSRVVPKDYQLVPVVMALEMPACACCWPTMWESARPSKLGWAGEGARVVRRLNHEGTKGERPEAAASLGGGLNH